MTCFEVACINLLVTACSETFSTSSLLSNPHKPFIIEQDQDVEHDC